jgi:glutamate racemase
MSDDRPIGVFDSGLGGLTVVRAIRDTLPSESIAYFGDTARYPYGPRPLEQVREFAVEIALHLAERDVKIIVIACNTATAAALDDVAAAVPVPVIGVIEPAVRAAMEATRNGRVGLIGTEGTVRSGAYQRALDRLKGDRTLDLIAQACPRFVEFVERGDTTSPELLATAESYLALLRVASVDTLILGCTHYPLLRAALRHVMGDEVVFVSSADETASKVYDTLTGLGALRDSIEPGERTFESSGGDDQQFSALVTLFMAPSFFDRQAEVRLSSRAGDGGSRWS